MDTNYLSQPPERFNPLNDYLFLKVMGEKGGETQLLGFINAALRLTGADLLPSVEIIENKVLSAEFLGGKTGILDVRAKLPDGTKINIEAQLKHYKGFDRRIMFYEDQVYIEDQKEGDRYRDFPKVIILVIVDFNFLPERRYRANFHMRDEDDPTLIFTDSQNIRCFDMTKWRKLDKIEIDDPLHRWLAWFDKNSPPELIEEIITMDDARIICLTTWFKWSGR